MKSIFEKTTREEIISRIKSLSKEAVPIWGKMNLYQMLKHCTLWEEMVLGKLEMTRVFPDRPFGQRMLKGILKENGQLGKNAPSIKELKATGTDGDIIFQKQEWIDRITDYEHFNIEIFTHPFFGKMSSEQIGQFAVKHADHHLRQFGA